MMSGKKCATMQEGKLGRYIAKTGCGTEFEKKIFINL